MLHSGLNTGSLSIRVLKHKHRSGAERKLVDEIENNRHIMEANLEYKLVVFDMGNTLLDFHAGKHSDEEKDMIGCKNIKEYLKENHSVNVSSKTIKSELIDVWYSDFYKRQQLIELDVCIYVNRFMQKIGCENHIVNCKVLMRAFYKPYMDEVIINKGGLDALKSIGKTMKIGVISNCILFDAFYEEVFKIKGLYKYVDKFIFSYSRQIRKPDKRLFEEMLTCFDCAPHEAIMIGDSYQADILPAKALGMKTVHLTHKHSKESAANICIKSLEEVIESIKCL